MGRKCLVTDNVGMAVLGLVSTVTTEGGEGTEDVGEQGSPKVQVETQSDNEEEPHLALTAVGRRFGFQGHARTWSLLIMPLTLPLCRFITIKAAGVLGENNVCPVSCVELLQRKAVSMPIGQAV